jgi:purine catabolism regulator
MSRAAFYERLDTIARILDVDMTSGEVCTTLHAAVMAVEAEYPTALPVTTTR